MLDANTCPFRLFDGALGTNPTLVCGHPEAIKQVTIKHFDSFTNRRRPMTWLSIRYRALTYMRDDEWKRMRCMLAPIFTSQKLKKMFELMQNCVFNLQDSILKQDGKQIDLKRLFSVFTVDVISTCCFSMDLKDYRHPDSEILLSARSFFNVSRFKMACGMILPKLLLRALKFDINDVKSIDFFQRFAQNIINKRRKLAELKGKDFKKQDDFLQVLIDAASEFCGRSNKNEAQAKLDTNNATSNNNSVDNKSNNNASDVEDELEKTKANTQKQVITEQQLGDIEILAQAMLFLAVGHETTATLLSSCGYFLALHPEMQDRLHSEISEAFDEGKGSISYDKLLELKYLDAFISESLRYFTPTLNFDREASEDVEIDVDGFKVTIPKGMGVVIPFHAIHHDPENFPNPSQFNPDRFMPENKHLIKPCTFIPFGSGPRYCLASRFALIEVRLALAHLVRKFRFVKSEGTIWPPKYRYHYMLLQMDWPKICFELRSQNNDFAKATANERTPQVAA